MNSILLLVLGVLLGALVGWLLAAAGTKSEMFRSKVEAEGRVKSAESALLEVRSQFTSLQSSLGDREKELDALRQHLQDEIALRVKARTDLENARAELEDVDALRERLKSEGEQRVAAETRLRETQASLEEQKRLLQEAEANLTKTFDALSAKALRSNNDEFLKLARAAFDTLQAQAKGDLETRQQAIDGLVSPLKDTLGRYEHQILEMEKARQKAYGTLDEQLRSLAQANQTLEEETRRLASALASPLKVRGRWGELTLRRVVELAGMSEHCDFSEQETIATESGWQRPDMIVNLPGNRRIAVDAKVPLQAFLNAVSPEKSEAERAEALAAHGRLVRSHMNQLAERRYWEQVGPELELVVMFMPGESFFSVALEQDPKLIEDAMQKKVVLAIPPTLISVLVSAAYLWQQEKVAENAQAISDLGKELYDRIRTFLNHLRKVGDSLKSAVDAHNKAVGSMESRVLPAARKFRELGAATGEEIPALEPVDEAPRSLAAPERDGQE